MLSHLFLLFAPILAGLNIGILYYFSHNDSLFVIFLMYDVIISCIDIITLIAITKYHNLSSKCHFIISMFLFVVNMIVFVILQSSSDYFVKTVDPVKIIIYSYGFTTALFIIIGVLWIDKPRIPTLNEDELLSINEVV